MSFPNGKLDLKSNSDDQVLIPKQWAPQYPMYDGDNSPLTPGTYYTNLKTPDGSLFKRYDQKPIFKKKKTFLLPYKLIAIFVTKNV